MKDTYKEKKW